MYVMSCVLILQTGMASAPPLPHLVTKVELTISCQNLLDKDVLSKSDPMCVLSINTSDSHWYEVCGGLSSAKMLFFSVLFLI